MDDHEVLKRFERVQVLTPAAKSLDTAITAFEKAVAPGHDWESDNEFSSGPPLTYEYEDLPESVVTNLRDTCKAFLAALSPDLFSVISDLVPFVRRDEENPEAWERVHYALQELRNDVRKLLTHLVHNIREGHFEESFNIARSNYGYRLRRALKDLKNDSQFQEIVERLTMLDELGDVAPAASTSQQVKEIELIDPEQAIPLFKAGEQVLVAAKELLQDLQDPAFSDLTKSLLVMDQICSQELVAQSLVIRAVCGPKEADLPALHEILSSLRALTVRGLVAIARGKVDEWACEWDCFAKASVETANMMEHADCLRRRLLRISELPAVQQALVAAARNGTPPTPFVVPAAASSDQSPQSEKLKGKELAEAAVIAFLHKHPNDRPTSKEIGDSVEMDARIIRKTDTWKAYKAQLARQGETVDAENIGEVDETLEELIGTQEIGRSGRSQRPVRA